ncbi:uronate dehydrogenase [Abditibacteriota bacterium]|nr:uronate dehydrogenase [Abditibacteriota bacterium]
MKILVTGAAGTIGRIVVRDLLDAGHEVRAFDRAPLPRELRDKCESQLGDLTDRYAVLKAVEGVEGVAHLGAIPNPENGSDLILFPPNVLGTQLVFEACEAFDVGRVALASSGSIFGFAFQNAPHGEEKIGPHYLPMTEEHPIENCDVYGLSKQCNEITAGMYSRRTGMATTCLRLGWVNSTERLNPWMRRALERGGEWKSRDLWGYVDRRDAARAFRLALEHVENGHHILHIMAQDYWSTLPYRALLELHYPSLLPSLDEAVAAGYDASQGGWNTKRAQELLGWKSQHHWGDLEELKDLVEQRSQSKA